MSHRSDWIGGIERDARRYGVVFLHVGCAFEPLRGQLTADGRSAVPAEQYLAGDVEVDNERLVYVLDVEKCATSRKLDLGKLRARVLDGIDDRAQKFVLVSRMSRAAFPAVPGSDLLSDAKHVFVEPNEVAPGEPPLSGLPGWATAQQTAAEFLATCVSELSAETVINLGELTWELALSPNDCIERLNAVDRESLRGAGLVRMLEDGLVWVAAKEWKAHRAAIATASSRFTTSADWLAQVFLDLWILERQVRNAIRDALIVKHGPGWRSTCVAPSAVDEIVERARRDVQPQASGLKDLRDPLEWLTTTELLELRVSRELGELGLESFMWTKLRADVLPIRNRAAHMRVVSERDALTVATWKKIVLDKLCPDG